MDGTVEATASARILAISISTSRSCANSCLLRLSSSSSAHVRLSCSSPAFVRQWSASARSCASSPRSTQHSASARSRRSRITMTCTARPSAEKVRHRNKQSCSNQSRSFRSSAEVAATPLSLSASLALSGLLGSVAGRHLAMQLHHPLKSSKSSSPDPSLRTPSATTTHRARELEALAAPAPLEQAGVLDLPPKRSPFCWAVIRAQSAKQARKRSR
mmetsp:Transcript_141022/g.256325  ORF Transcript_141022/g.256325 Transcript_141022/m.256325 type:complete len:216 (-) Transcript_141022:29-676(-)